MVDDSTKGEGERDGQQLLFQDGFHLGAGVNIRDRELLGNKTISMMGSMS